jgi:hypothetical protein
MSAQYYLRAVVHHVRSGLFSISLLLYYSSSTIQPGKDKVTRFLGPSTSSQRRVRWESHVNQGQARGANQPRPPVGQSRGKSRVGNLINRARSLDPFFVS